MLSINKDKVFFIISQTTISLSVANENECKFFRTFDGYPSLIDFLLETPLNNSIEIVIIIDTAERNINLEKVISISYSNFNKNIKSITNSKTSTDDIFIGHFGTYIPNNYQQNIFFISITQDENIKKILTLLSNYNNPIVGIYSIITKSFSLYSYLHDTYNYVTYQNNINYWEFLCYFTSSKNLRLTIFKNSVFFDEDLISVSNLDNNIAIKENILEIINRKVTILDLPVEEKLSIYIICSKDIKNSLQSNSILADKLVILDTDELRINLKVQSKASKNFFIDDILITKGMQGEQLAPLNNKDTKREMLFYSFYQTSKKLLLFLFAFIIISFMSLSFDILNNRGTKNTLKSKIQIYDQSIKAVTDDLKKFTNQEDIIQSLNVYDILFGQNQSILEVISQISNLKNDAILIKKLNWNLIESLNFTDKDSTKLTILIDLKLKHQDERDFMKFNQFVNELSGLLRNYNLSFKRLPEKIDNSLNIPILPIELTIWGPLNDF